MKKALQKIIAMIIRGLWEYNVGKDVTDSLDYTLTQDVQIYAQ